MGSNLQEEGIVLALNLRAHSPSWCDILAPGAWSATLYPQTARSGLPHCIHRRLEVACHVVSTTREQWLQRKWVWAIKPQVHSQWLIPLARLRFLKVPQPSKTAPAAGKWVVRHASPWRTFPVKTRNHNRLNILYPKCFRLEHFSF